MNKLEMFQINWQEIHDSRRQGANKKDELVLWSEGWQLIFR